MEQSPSREINIPSASQGIPRILWNRAFRYRVRNIQPLVSFRSEINFSQYLHHIHLTYILILYSDQYQCLLSGPFFHDPY